MIVSAGNLALFGPCPPSNWRMVETAATSAEFCVDRVNLTRAISRKDDRIPLPMHLSCSRADYPMLSVGQTEVGVAFTPTRGDRSLLCFRHV